ncbi:MAG: exodeoxyribonuclease III, partial [Burkholderiaceae bacterium]
MFRITTLNVNGLRSATRKGLTQWLELSQPDVVCLQEVKADECDIPVASRPQRMRAWYHCAARRGYAGTALYAAKRPRAVRLGFGSKEFDAEGRYVEAQFSAVTVISVYFPSGSS